MPHANLRVDLEYGDRMMPATVTNLQNDRQNHVSPVSPGAAIAARRRYLGLKQEDLVERTSGAINGKLLSQLENNHKHPASLRLGKYRALLSVLQWTPAEFEEAAGVPPLTVDAPQPPVVAYSPDVSVPVIDMSALRSATRREVVMTSGRMISLDTSMARLGSASTEELVAIECDGHTVVSERAAHVLQTGSMVVVELSSLPRGDDLVVSFLPRRDLVAVHRAEEREGAIFRSLHANGVVFRLSPDEPVEVRGVVRVVMLYP